MEAFNQYFLSLKSNKGFRVEKFEFNPIGYVEYFGKQASLLIRVSCTLPDHVDKFDDVFDKERGAVILRASSSHGRGECSATYLLWGCQIQFVANGDRPCLGEKFCNSTEDLI